MGRAVRQPRARAPHGGGFEIIGFPGGTFARCLVAMLGHGIQPWRGGGKRRRQVQAHATDKSRGNTTDDGGVRGQGSQSRPQGLNQISTRLCLLPQPLIACSCRSLARIVGGRERGADPPREGRGGSEDTGGVCKFRRHKFGLGKKLVQTLQKWRGNSGTFSG